jgi:hypothetical protein
MYWEGSPLTGERAQDMMRDENIIHDLMIKTSGNTYYDDPLLDL